MKIWAATLPNVEHGKLMPAEDRFAFSENVFCVADGVTRDPIGITDLTGYSKKEALRNYPNPSPAAAAADICANAYVRGQENNISHNAREALIACNNQIAKLNKDLKCDYLENDWASTVAVGGKIIDKILYWSAIGDCQLTILSQDGRVKFTSPNGLKSFEHYIQQAPGDWRKPERRALIRSQFRNNPKQIKNNELVSYGVLTGEKAAEYFIMDGQQEIGDGDIIAFYSDGFTPYINLPEFSQKLHNKDEFVAWQQTLAAKEPNKLGKERTIIVVRA